MSSLEQDLAALLRATPDPPHLDADPAAVLEAAQALVSARAPLLDAMRAGATGPTPPLAPVEQQLLAELKDRDARWDAALTRARQSIADGLAAFRRTRRAQSL